MTDTAEIGVAGAGLTNINLPNQTMDIVGNITGNLSGSVGSVTGAVGSVTGAVGSVTGLTNATIADQVWDEALAGHLGVGSTGEALNAAGAAGDPWTTGLPGAYGAGSAGFIIGTNINAPIATIDTVVDAIKAKTDSLTFTVANKVDSNVKSVNDVTVNGTGAAGNEWGPSLADYNTWGTSFGSSWGTSWGGGTPAVETYSGGWFDTPARKRKTKAELRLEREEWGVLPKKAKALIKRVAAQQVEVEEPDNTEALIAAFNRAELAFKEEFRVLYQREIERQLAKMREEEEILLLLH